MIDALADLHGTQAKHTKGVGCIVRSHQTAHVTATASVRIT